MRKNNMITLENKIELSFAYMGYFTGSRGWIHSYVTINTNEVIFVTKGTVYLRENNIDYILKPGDLIFLSPNVCHGGYKRSEEPVEFYYLHFFDKNGDALSFKKYYHIEDIYNYKNAFRKLNHLVLLKKNRSLIECNMTAMLLELNETSDALQNKLCYDITEYIRIHLADPPDIPTIASHFQYCPDYLSKLFVKYYHMPLKKYISLERVAFIKSYLSTTNYSIKQMANLCNFESENLLVKFFKYHTNTTPSEFRNSLFASHLN